MITVIASSDLHVASIRHRQPCNPNRDSDCNPNPNQMELEEANEKTCEYEDQVR